VDAWNTHPIPRLGIPSVTMTDGPHGVRATHSDGPRPSQPVSLWLRPGIRR
jgi:beta-glucosidase